MNVMETKKTTELPIEHLMMDALANSEPNVVFPCGVREADNVITVITQSVHGPVVIWSHGHRPGRQLLVCEEKNRVKTNDYRAKR